MSAFNESQHPRAAKGTKSAGKFVDKTYSEPNMTLGPNPTAGKAVKYFYATNGEFEVYDKSGLLKVLGLDQQTTDEDLEQLVDLIGDPDKFFIDRSEDVIPSPDTPEELPLESSPFFATATIRRDPDNPEVTLVSGVREYQGKWPSSAALGLNTEFRRLRPDESEFHIAETDSTGTLRVRYNVQVATESLCERVCADALDRTEMSLGIQSALYAIEKDGALLSDGAVKMQGKPKAEVILAAHRAGHAITDSDAPALASRILGSAAGTESLSPDTEKMLWHLVDGYVYSRFEMRNSLVGDGHRRQPLDPVGKEAVGALSSWLDTPRSVDHGQ